MENSKKKALGSLKSIVEFYQGLFRDGVIEEGSSGYSRMLQLEKLQRNYGRGRSS